MLKPTGPTPPAAQIAAGSGFPPQHAQGPAFHHPDRQSSQRKTAPPVRMQPRSLHRGSRPAASPSARRSILDLQPEAIHQRVTFYAGAHDMVMKVKEFLNFFNNIPTGRSHCQPRTTPVRKLRNDERTDEF